MEKEIVFSIVKSNKSNNLVWAVSITGDEQPSAHCKSAYKAMRFMFLLKQKTGVNISGECLAQLSQEIARKKAEQAEAGKEKIAEVTQEFVGSHSVDAVLEEKPKRSRKPRATKSAETAAVPQ